MTLLRYRHRIAVITFFAVLVLSASFGAAQTVDSRVPTAAPTPVASAATAPVGRSFASQEIVLIEVKGEVLIQSAGSSEWIPAKKDQRLSPADIIDTGEKGAASITPDRKARIDLLPGSRMTVEQASRNGSSRATTLQLDFGRLKADIQKLSGDSKFEIKTPTAVASVRGTTIFVNTGATGDGPQGKNTDLFVDKGLVNFFPLGSPKTGQLVDKYGLSSIFGDGSILELRHLSDDERKEFIDSFEAAFKNAGNPQGEVEETGAEDADDDDDDDDSKTDLSDIREDQSQRRLGDGAADLGLKADGLLLSEGLPKSGDFNYELIAQFFRQGIVSEERVGPRDTLLGATTQGQAQSAFNQLFELRSKEHERIRVAMRGVLAGILDDQRFNEELAKIERAGDQQTGKVFKDVHGNRVRTDQYIFKPDDTSLHIVSLTLRTGDYQPGVSSVVFGVRFSESIPNGLSFRDLPWSDYMNVVTRHEMADRLDIPEQVFDQKDNAWKRNPKYDALSEQYVVHESSIANGLAEGGFWPEQFVVEFRNPLGGRDASDLIRFDEFFEDPEDYIGNNYYLVGASTGGNRYLVQPLEASLMFIAPSGQLPILVGDVLVEGQMRRFIQIGTSDLTLFPQNSFSDSDDGAQTRGFAEFANAPLNRGLLGSADGINFLRNHENNENGDVSDDLHPAYFEDELHDRYEYQSYGQGQGSNVFVGTNTLIGIFLPIDNSGNVLNADGVGHNGFQVNGIRDLFVPNTHVNNGNYNLETIFAYGYVAGREGDEIFYEDFRIDAIITPELLGHHNFVNNSVNFPASLDDYEDDHTRGYPGECDYDCEE